MISFITKGDQNDCPFFCYHLSFLHNHNPSTVKEMLCKLRTQFHAYVIKGHNLAEKRNPFSGY